MDLHRFASVGSPTRRLFPPEDFDKPPVPLSNLHQRSKRPNVSTCVTSNARADQRRSAARARGSRSSRNAAYFRILGCVLLLSATTR